MAFGKTNLTANAPGIISRSWTGSLKKMYRQQRGGGGGSGGGGGGGGGSDSFLQLIEMPQNLHADAGAPARAWTRFDFSRNDPGAQINITLSWFNKTRTRLPESHWMDFELSLPKARRTKGRKGAPVLGATAVAAGGSSSDVETATSTCDSWLVPKLNSTFCATDVSLFGATHVHGVSDAAPLRWPSGLGLRTLDAAIVALEYKSALPEHVNTTVDEEGVASQAAYVNLCNNFWTTK